MNFVLIFQEVKKANHDLYIARFKNHTFREMGVLGAPESEGLGCGDDIAYLISFLSSSFFVSFLKPVVSLRHPARKN